MIPVLKCRRCGHHLAENDGPWSVQLGPLISHSDAALQSLLVVVAIHATTAVDDQTSNYIEGTNHYSVYFSEQNRIAVNNNIPMTRTVHWLQCKLLFFYLKLEHVILNKHTLIRITCNTVPSYSQNNVASVQKSSIICGCKHLAIPLLGNHVFDIQTKVVTD